MTVADRVGVMADIANVLGQCGISIASLLQDDPGDDAHEVPLIILTHETTEGAVAQAIQALSDRDCVRGKVVKMRIQG